MMEMLVDNKYKKAFSEVLEILKYVPNEEYNKIPKELVEMFEECSDKENVFKIDADLSFSKIGLSESAKGILVNLYTDFWVSGEERENIKKEDNLKRSLSDKQKKKKYNPEDVFNKKERSTEKIAINNTMIEYKKNIFTKIIDMIKKALNVR